MAVTAISKPSKLKLFSWRGWQVSGPLAKQKFIFIRQLKSTAQSLPQSGETFQLL
jgi:hypothetical protein